MEWIARAARRVKLVLRRDRVEASMDAEFRDHIECEIAYRVARGMSHGDARRTTLRDFGGVEALKEEAREARGGRALEEVLMDMRYAVRVLRRNPAFTATAVLTFALGVGAVTAIFSLVYGILLRPLPYGDPSRLVVVWEKSIPKNRDRNVVSLDNFEAWREHARSFSAMSAVVPTSVTLPGEPAPERLMGAEVSPGFFATLRVPPTLGRDFLPADATNGSSVILSDGLWRRRFNADASIVGQPITLSGRAYTVVGVMPRDFDPPRVGWLGEQDLWFPLVASAQARSWGRVLIVFARLSPSASLQQAAAEMATIAGELAKRSAANQGWSTSIVPLAREMTDDVRMALLVLLGSVALLMLMAVANVATMTLSMLARRTQELAVRRAIGATDRRLFQQLFTQSAIVGALGAAAGALVAVPGVRALVALLPPDVPRPQSVAVDAPVLLVTTTIAVGATLVFGCVASLSGGRSADACAIRRAAGSARISPVTGRGVLVAIEIALAAALCVMASLMTRTYSALRAVDFGFDGHGVAVARVAAPATDDAPQRRRAFFDRVLEGTQALPGVTAAGIISARPLSGVGPATTVHDARRPADPNGVDPVADVRYASAGAFAALGISFTHGSAFDDTAIDGPPRVVVSETLARTVWGESDPIGRSLSMRMNRGIVATVVGVVPDIHLIDARTNVRPVAFLQTARYTDNVRDVVVRVAGDPAAIIPSLRRVVADIDSSIPLFSASTLPALVDRTMARDRLTTVFLAAFALLALLLSSVGVFGVLAGEIAAQRKEIAIRLALGSRNARIVGLLLCRVLPQVATGMTIGLATALFSGRAMESLLFGVRYSDPVAFAATAVIVVPLVVVATVIPTAQVLRRAPLATLREG